MTFYWLLKVSKNNELAEYMLKKPQIIFLNQVAGSLFRELAEDLSMVYPPCIMFTGQQETLKSKTVETLTIQPAPPYLRYSLFTGLWRA